jgi:hypothetical protein
MGTPIGDLIAAAPDPGSHALYDLYSYARLSNDLISTKKFKLCEPTHKNLIKLFDLQRPGSRTGAEYCKLLVRHGVLRVVKRFLSRETWLYYSQKNQRPNPGALGWNNNAPTSEEIPRIGAIDDYITRKWNDGDKKMMFSEIDNACRFVDGEAQFAKSCCPGHLTGT